MHKDTRKAVLSLSLACMLACVGFSGCHMTRVDGNRPHTHSFTEDITNPTCTNDGLKISQCACGQYLEEPLPALGHRYVNGVCEHCGQNMLDELSYTLSADGSYYILSSIGNYNLLELTVPDTYNGLPIKEIGSYVFRESTEELKYVNLGSSITKIADHAFYASRIQYITLSEGLTSIGEHAFSGCDIRGIELPQSLTEIGACAFAVSNLVSITIPNNVTKIEADSFALCNNLKSVNIGNGVTIIGVNAFHQCTSLEFIILGEQLTTIENQAFYECESLTNVYYNGTIYYWDQISIGKSNSYLTDAKLYIAYK